MLTVCAWCNRFLGPDRTEVSHGICGACASRQRWRDSPVLVVSRQRESLVPVLNHLLSGDPAVQIVVDRRCDCRRREASPGVSVERRSGSDRRHRAEMFLI